jgi:oligopeptidase B
MLRRLCFSMLTATMVLTILWLIQPPACDAQEAMKPPVAGIIPKTDTVNGEVRTDNYFWLRDKTNPEVISYLEAENAYTEGMLKQTESLQKTLYDEMVGRIKETDLDVPEQNGEYLYYTRTEEGKQYPIHCRKKGTLDGAEEILLDPNVLGSGHKYFDIGVFRVSPDHHLLAYSVDTAGSEEFTLYIKDLVNNRLLRDEIPNTSTGVEWAGDGKTLFYSTLDAAKRPYKLFRHILGGSLQNDSLVYHETDDAYYLDLTKTRSKAYLLLKLESETTSEVRYLAAEDARGSFKIIHPRQHEMEYRVDHHGDQFFIVTNDNAQNFRLMKAPVADPVRANWTEVIGARESVKLDDVDAFADHLVIYEREGGLKKIRVRDFNTGEDHDVTFPEPVYNYFSATNPEYDTHLLRFTYTSLVTPRSVYDYDMAAKTRELKKQYEVLGGYDPSKYQSERVLARAADGRKIPISLVYRKGMKKDGSSPLLLYGYGAYGSSADPNFSSNRLSLLDRGFIYAIAHVRGGGEMGRPWYDDGKLLRKKNTFTDFIACAEHLIAEKYTSKEKLAINGGSAGGLLMGAVVTMRPDLFHVVVAKVPFVDVINTMLDESIPLTVIEFEEWGNPKDKKFYEYMKSYSPYDNVAAREYPAMLITAGLNDPRVPFWEPAKFAAKLRAIKTDNHLLLLKVNMGAGHGGSSGRYDYLKEIALDYAFILDRFGITK